MLLMSRYGVRFTGEMTKDLFTRLTNQQNQIIIVNITKNRDYFYNFCKQLYSYNFVANLYKRLNVNRFLGHFIR